MEHRNHDSVWWVDFLSCFFTIVLGVIEIRLKWEREYALTKIIT